MTSAATSQPSRRAAHLGFWSALATAVSGIAALAVAIATPPRAGPFAAPASALRFPYAEAAAFVPRDFLWMYPALLMMLSFLVLAICLRERAASEARAAGTVGMQLALLGAGIVIVNYFIQLQTVQPALLRGEAQSVVTLSQYNPHGVFIALESIGFLLLSVALAFLATTLGRAGLERAVFWLFSGCAAVSGLAFVLMWWYYGFDLEYRFEVAVISVLWLTLIVTGALLAVVFARERRSRTSAT